MGCIITIVWSIRKLTKYFICQPVFKKNKNKKSLAYTSTVLCVEFPVEFLVRLSGKAMCQWNNVIQPAKNTLQAKHSSAPRPPATLLSLQCSISLITTLPIKTLRLHHGTFPSRPCSTPCAGIVILTAAMSRWHTATRTRVWVLSLISRDRVYEQDLTNWTAVLDLEYSRWAL